MAVRMLWKEKDRSRVRAIQMDNLRELLGVRRRMGGSPGDEPLTLTRCHSYGLPQLYEAFVGWKSILWPSPSIQLKGHEGEILFIFTFLSFASLLL